MKKNRKILPSILYRVLPLTGLALIVIWASTRTMANRAVNREIEERLNVQLILSAEEISKRLHHLADTAKGLAANDLVVNGLIDTAPSLIYPRSSHSSSHMRPASWKPRR